MRELMQSMMRFSWAMSLLGVKQLGNLFQGKSGGVFDAVTRAAAGQLSGGMGAAFQSGDRLQRNIVDSIFGAAEASAGSASAPPTEVPRARPVHGGRLNASNLVVLGEGLAAGVGDFRLSSETQQTSFAVQMARQMQVEFPLPLLEGQGISGGVPGFAELPVLIPGLFQTTVRDCAKAVSNLSVPGLRVSDAGHLRPVPPLVHRNCPKQTSVNLIWGAESFVQGQDGPLPTQLEYALQRRPTFCVVELGYSEAVEAAVRGDLGLLPGRAAFRSDYQKLLRSLRESGADVLLMTVPDPIDTAHFSTIDSAAATLKLDSALLLDLYRLGPDDLVTVNGLAEISFQLFGKQVGPLPSAAVLSREVAQEIRSRVSELNTDIVALANECGALTYDLHALFRTVRQQRLAAGSRTLTAEYLGGFYSLNGCYPGQTGQAIIANDVLRLLNRTYGADFPLLDPQAVLATDAVAAYRAAEGPVWKTLPPQPPRPEPPAPEPPRYAAPRAPAAGGRLQLPGGLEQVLPLCKASSYFGDGISPMNCTTPQEIQWGSGANLLFGGLALVDSHLNGSIRIKFSPPTGDVTKFQVFYEGGFAGDDAVLASPQFFRMPFQQNRVDEVPGMSSAGTLNLATGEVSNLTMYARYSSNALFALVSVNPTFPKQPLSFPGPYGSAWARFEQRSDGKLDFTFYGSTFVPLGKDILWPLNFVGPSLQFATIPASGTVMHPHLHLSTREPEPSEDADGCPEIPFNTIEEFTLHTHNSAFGDKFTLNVPQLGGPAKGRSHVMGRLQVQFGERTGNSVPIAVSCLRPGGVLLEFPPSPISAVFPGRLTPGPQGFYEFLRFPLRTYSLDDLAIIDDPFDISVGAVDLKTGKLLGGLLHRSFIHQDLIFALLRVEPRTPKDSFFFRGPARVQKGRRGRMVVRFEGIVRVPYPSGFQFPQPNLTTGFTVGPDSVLDPFLWLRGVQEDVPANYVKQGSVDRVISSTGECFSCRYSIPSDPTCRKVVFEYENQSQKGAFRMHSLSWVGFSNTLASQSAAGEYDTVTFSGFGVWSKDGTHSLQQAAVQISTAPEAPYLGIQIALSDVSNVNTKPENEALALP